MFPPKDADQLQELAPLKKAADEAKSAVGETAVAATTTTSSTTMPWFLEKTAREKESAKWERLMRGASDKAPPLAAKYINSCAPCAAKCIVCCEACTPYYLKCLVGLYVLLDKLPTDWFGVVWGLCLTFFGGFYPLTMAAYEAFRQCGGEDTYAAIQDLKVEFLKARAADLADDLVDADGDGVADVEQITAKDLVKRKSHLMLTSTNPDKLDSGFKGVYTAWLAVIAALKVQFAMLLALGAAIGDFLAALLRVPFTQILVHVMEDDVHKWIPQVISYTCKIFAIIVAWYIQKIISTFYSAVRGGLMVSRSGMKIVGDKFPRFKIDPDESYLDEILGWLLAAVGFAFQFALGFGPPLPIAILLWPFGLCEAALLWAVVSSPNVQE